MLFDTKKRDLCKACPFTNTFCFINDLCAINDHLEFDRNFKNIYPSGIKLKKKGISTSQASFLNLSIMIENKKCKTKLYDKRDAFPFCVVRMPQLDSNIPSQTTRHL